MGMITRYPFLFSETVQERQSWMVLPAWALQYPNEALLQEQLSQL